MAKSKVKKTGVGFVIEGILDFENQCLSVDEIGDFPLEAVFRQFDGKTIKIKVDEPDEEILSVPVE